MLIEKFLSAEKGLAEPDTIFSQPDENHDHNDSSHRHAECLKPYNPKTARKSIGRGPAFKLSLGSKTKISPVTTEQQQQQQYQHQPQQQQTQEMFLRESATVSKMYGIPGVDPLTDEDMDDPTGGMLPGIASDYGANISSTGNGPKVNSSVIAVPKINTGLNTPYGNGPVSDGKRQGSSMVKTSGRPSQTWKAGKPSADLMPTESKSISKEVPTKTWKAVRFSSTISRGSNTTTSVLVTKSVQTVSTAYKLRLNRWPVWGGDSVDDQYYNGRPEVKKGYYYPLWLRRILSFIFSQFGILLFLTSWISGHAALFQHLEQQPDVKLVNDVVASRNELVITLATELRQVFPYEMAWRRKIDDYFIKFEATLNNATARGYSTNRRAFYKWEYLDFLLFSFQLVTGQGYGTDVPKTEWSLLLSIPCVLIGLPFMWLFLLDLGAKWADTVSNSIQRFRMNLGRRYPDVVSLQNDAGTLHLPPPPSLRHLHQNGIERYNELAPVIRPYQNGNGGRMLPNGDAQDSLRYYPHGSGDNSPTTRSVWTVEPVAVAMIPEPTAQAAKLTTVPPDDVYHHAAPWVATVFIVLYPFLGSLIFGFWGNLPFTTSFVLPLTSLILISPPLVFTSFLWRTLFHVYLLIGWVLLIASFLLWHQSWRELLRNWAHDLSIKHYPKTYPLQLR